MSSIRSFSEIGLCKVLSSDWLYPSNVQLKPIEAKGSIQESIGNNIEIFNSKEITSHWHYYGKPFRCVARSICFLAGGSIFAPIGVVYHGFFAVKESVVYLRATQAESDEIWKKVNDHVFFFFIDLKSTCFSFLYLFFLVKTGKYPTGHLDLVNILGCVGGSLYLSMLGADPKLIVRDIADEYDRASLYKTISLRNDFGITAQDGALLPYNSRWDHETKTLTGHFAELWRSRAIDLLFAIQDSKPSFREDLSEAERIFSTIHLRGSFKEIKDNTNLKKLSNIVERCLDFGTESKSDLLDRLTMTKNPFKTSFIKDFFTEIPEALWEETLNQRRKDLNYCPERYSASEEYNQLVERIEGKQKPHEILGFQSEPTTLIELRKKYKDIILFLHRVPASEIQVERIFRCVKIAYDMVNKKLE